MNLKCVAAISHLSNITGLTVCVHKITNVIKILKNRVLISVTHKSTVARTVMCRQDGRGKFPVLLDDLSKCRTNSQRKSQLS